MANRPGVERGWAFVVAVLAVFGPSSMRAEESGARREPPSLRYGARRESRLWIEAPGGVSHGVDEGIEWEGIRVYLAMMGELLAVDAGTGRCLWSRDVGSFWTGIRIVEVTGADGAPRWAVELAPNPGRGGADLRQVHDLRDGTVIPPSDGTIPSGEALEPRSWQGSESNVAEPVRELVTSAEAWAILRHRLFDGVADASAPAVADVDFAKEVVLIVSDGDRTNCAGIGVSVAWEEEGRILLRVAHATFQTWGEVNGGAQSLRPYGIFVLPRRAGKVYVVEVNVQSYLNSPPIWREVCRLGP
ncbi:MAG: hypothetical protein HY608_09650, partial [Planctomycetes bacterium]|nr:hypothetical protein [Planctomycetota bacterium]